MRKWRLELADHFLNPPRNNFCRPTQDQYVAKLTQFSSLYSENKVIIAVIVDINLIASDYSAIMHHASVASTYCTIDIVLHSMTLIEIVFWTRPHNC